MSDVSLSHTPNHNVESQMLSIQYHPVNDLIADPKNPRTHTKRQIRQIARSIEAFGFNVPLLVDQNLRIVAGHGQSRQSTGIASRCKNFASTAAEDFAPQPGKPGYPSAASPTSAR